MKLKMKVAPTFEIEIYIAGDYGTAVTTCRKFCERGLCVTVEPLDFVYTGGLERGVRVGLRNYPRFPTTKEQLAEIAGELGELLRQELCQDSYMIVSDEATMWFSRRDQT